MAMNDDNVLTAVREGFAPVRMETPATAIMARGTMMRRRRRNGGRLTAGAMAAALGAGLGVSAFAHGGTAQDAALAAWTVQQRPDGTVLVTVRKLDDMAALRARLAPYGVSIATEANPKLAMVCDFPALPLSAPRAWHVHPVRGVPIVVPPIVVSRAGLKEVFDGTKTFRLPDGHRLRIKFVHVIGRPGKATLVEPLHCVLKPYAPAKLTPPVKPTLPVKQTLQPPTPPTPATPATPAS
jgi:hypothetical protein